MPSPPSPNAAAAASAAATRRSAVPGDTFPISRLGEPKKEEAEAKGDAKTCC
eukprot:evm.model.NODE_15585_length_3615_cov_17.018810.2